MDSKGGWLLMAEHKVVNTTQLDADLLSIAEAIRLKGGTEVSLEFPQGFIDAVDAITVGESKLVEKDINFYNYDGTLLHTFTFGEANSLSELPSLPSNTSDITYAWTCSIDEVKSCCLTETPIDIAISRTFSSKNFPISKIYVSDPENEVFKFGITNMSTSIYTRLSVFNPEGVEVFSSDFDPSEAINLEISFSGGSKGLYTFSYTSNPEKYNGMTIGGVGKNAAINLPDKPSLKMIYDIEINDNIATTQIDFKGSTNLHSVIWNNTSDIPQSVFYGCVNLTNFEIVKNIKTIKPLAFEKCASLKFFNIRNGITTLYSSVFCDCSNLETLIIPNTISGDLSVKQFYNCAKLKTVKFPSDAQIFNSDALSGCVNLTNIILPSSLAMIAPNCFSDCISLKKVVFPNSIFAIENGVFNNCINMKYYDFRNCTYIPNLTSDDVFAGIPNDCKILVPMTLLENWKAAENWSAYANHIVSIS
jgi:hypothetical protein